MSKDFLTTIFGVLGGVAIAGKDYIDSSGDITGWGFIFGLGSAIAVALLGYYSNKK